MKIVKLIALFALFGFAANAQDIKYPALDASPADIAYFPGKAVMVKKGEKSNPLIKVIYSRPSVKGREIFGALEPFREVWRLGANENTEIKFYRTVTVGKIVIPRGTYSLFAIPDKNKWVIIFNKQTDRWGAYTYDATFDVARVEVPVKPLDNPVEALSIVFTELPTGAQMNIAWDKTSVAVPFTINK